MASAESEVPPTGNVEEKLGGLSLDEPAAETPEQLHENLVEEINEGIPELHHVETTDTTDAKEDQVTEGGAVKAEVPEAFVEELKADHDIVPPETTTTETVRKDVGAEDGVTPPVTSETPVEVIHEDVTAKKPTITEKISETFHKIVG